MVEKTIQLTGTSPNGVEEAIEMAIACRQGSAQAGGAAI